MSRNRLGKGLGALITDTSIGENSQTNGKLKEIYVQYIDPNPFQPRQEFNVEVLKELAQSIKEKGIIQPITVRQVKPDRYQLVTGERRLRASRMIGLKKIPAIIKDYNDQEMMETALIENLQREDLNPIEEAQAYQRMIEEFDMTQEEVSQKVGKSRSSIANTVRLLNLSPKVQVLVSRETITMGHARALLSLKDHNKQIESAEYLIKNNLSVRDTEKYISSLNSKTKNNKLQNNMRKKQLLEPEWVKAQDELAQLLGTQVKIKNKDNSRYLMIKCDNYNDLKRIINSLS